MTRLLGRAALGFVAVGVVAAIACSGGSGPGPGGKGLCVGSCPKTCAQDSDCPSGGQLCCDFGKNGKACTTPQSCPRFCDTDAKCRTDMGESCCQPNAAATEKVCAQAAACHKTCAQDNDCAGTATPKCCTDYARPYCTSVSACPNQCAQSSDCNTMAGETCCTTLKGLDKNNVLANVKGLCLAQGVTCPKACAQSSECNTAAGQLCCDGFCATTCQKACDTNNDCQTDKGQLCCQSMVIASPWYGFTATTPPPPCGGTGRCTNTADCSATGRVCCAVGRACAGGTCLNTCTTATQCTQAAGTVCN